MRRGDSNSIRKQPILADLRSSQVHSARGASQCFKSGRDDQDKSKSTGVLYPAAKLSLDKDKQLSLDLLQNPWQLINISWGH
jgi:hypothetical protein